MIKNVFAKFRQKRATRSYVSRDVLETIYKLLQHTRQEIVESFNNIKNRRLREVYDSFTFMMIKVDKTIQFLRRVLEEDLYAKHPRLSTQEVEEYMAKLPVEVAMTMRNLIQTARLLKEFAASAPAPYINSIIKSVSSAVEGVAKYVDEVVE